MQILNLRSMKIFHTNHINEEDINENNDEISNMLFNLGLILDKKEDNNKDIENNKK